MKRRQIDKINTHRLEMNAKGYIRKSELKDYIGCSDAAARQAWEDIIDKISSEGKQVSRFGLEPERVMDYLHLTEKKIKEYAAMGL